MSWLSRGRVLALACVLLFVLGRPSTASVDGVVAGTVKDAFDHPLPGAIVVLHDHAGKAVARVVAGNDGRFTMPHIPLGDYTVEASYPGLAGDHQHVRITASTTTQVELVCTPEEVISIREDWAVPLPACTSGSVFSISRQQLDELPGGDARPITDVVATQPGFVGDALGNVYVRGNHANVQYQVDGIPVPDSVGSMFAASIPVRLIQSLDIYSGGMPAEFGNRLGAVVNLVTRRAGDHPDGAATVRYGSFGTVEPGAVYSRSLTNHLGLVLGGSFLTSHRALDPPSVDPILHDAGSIGRVFSRLDYVPSKRDRYELFTTYARNNFEIPLDPAATPFDPRHPRLRDRFGNDAPVFIPRDTNATETEHELFAAVSWTHTFSRGELQVAPLYKLSRGFLLADAPRALGSTADPGAVASDVLRVNQSTGGIVAYSLPEGRHLFKAGTQLELMFGRTKFTSYARDDAAGELDATRTAIGQDVTRAVRGGAYVQDRYTKGQLAIDLGLRADTLFVDAESTNNTVFGLSPRAGFAFSPNPKDKDTVIHLFTGVLWQPPQPLDATTAARALGAVPSGQTIVYDLRPETDVFAEIGIQSKLAPQLRGGLTAWGRYAWNQLDDTAIGSTSLLSNYNFERGRAAGLEASFDIRIGPWLSGFGNVTFGLAQGRGIATAKFLFEPADLASKDWQTLDHAQTITTNGGLTVRDGRFTLTGLLSHGSGLRTGDANTAHVPSHVRGDVSMRYTFVPREYPIQVGIDVINVGDQRYAYRIANGFVGSSFAPPRSVYLSMSIPLAREPHPATKQKKE